jgi:acetaldehyde/propanal dehydrogenase
MGIKTTADGVDGLLPFVKEDGIQIAFDATSAYVHAENSRKLNELGVLMIDLTPAAIGPYCVPRSTGRARGRKAMNVNMVTCGGQATIPMVAAVSACRPWLWRDRRHGVQPLRRPRHAQEHRRVHPHHRGAVEKVGGAKRARPSSSSTRPSRR